MRRWVRFSILILALLAIGFGVTHRLVNNTSSSWLSKATAQATPNQGVNGTTAPSAPTASGVGVLNNASSMQSSLTTGSHTTGSRSNTASTGSSVHPMAQSQASTPTVSKPISNQSPGHSVPPSTTKASLGSFTLIVSLYHGADVLARKTVPIVSGESLMQYMQEYFQVSTAYGGGFIVSINGIKSEWTGVPDSQRKPVDWFLYVNNVQAPVGAADIYPRASDMDVWDYHSWNPTTGRG